MQSRLFKVRDRRQKGWIYLDNEYLNGYAKIFGAIGTAIYVSHCRHADNETQECFPSMELIGEELSISRNTIAKYIKLFEGYQLITVEREKDFRGKWKNNTYFLLDKTEWKPHAQPLSMDSHAQPLTPPCTTADKIHAQPLRNKETQGEGDSYKETHVAAKAAPVFSLKEEIEKLYASERRDLNLIGWYFEKRKPDIRTREQYASALKRHLRAAKDLAPFTDDQLGKAWRHVSTEYPEWTLETCWKHLSK